jgi:putative phosphoesterase
MNATVNGQTCETDTSYCRFGCKTVREQLDAFEAQIDGVIKNGDIEYVHKMRVASRRIRAALPLFRSCFPKKDFKRWRREIKNVTRLLADARDLDVQIAFIEQYKENLPPAREKTGVDLLLKRQKDRRKSVQSSVVSGLEKLMATGVLGDVRKFCDQTIKQQANATFDPQKVLEKAHWHISSRLDDFLAMEKYVYLENEILKHHEMRIYAKKLRYTIEHFAPLYPNKLTGEIETVKAFQDVLGEMHDCDIRIDYIPKFIEETKTKIQSNKNKKVDPAKIEQELLNFLTYTKQKRKENYGQFVNLWEETQKKGFFDQLRKTTSVGLNMSEKKINKLLTNSNVTIAVMSDVHANLQALERVIQDAEGRGADVFLNAGDLTGFGPDPNEAIELLCEKNVLSILGNYDLEVIDGETKEKGEKQVALKFARKELSKSCEDYLRSLPHELRFEVAGVKLLVTHGSPESIDEHIYRDTPIERLKTLSDTAKADVIIVGHSHKQLWRQVNGTSFVNPGSVGRPGDGNPQAAYAILKFNPLKIEMIRLDYDVEAAADALRKKSLPESFAQMLLQGVSLERIIEEDAAREKAEIGNCKELVDASREFAKRYGQDEEHYSQVTKLALESFDGLVNVHNLGELERCWLECAAIMHDVGLSKGVSGHQKESARLILNDTQLPFSSRERRIVASVARYHRKGLPNQKHYNLKSLDRQTVKTIKILSSLLRVADSLDYTHQSNVRTLSFKVGTKKIAAICTCETESMLEQEAFNKKKDLFETTLGKKLVLAWKQQ